MKKKNEWTEVICVIDRSGSMESIRSDAIGGFNAFLKEQQEIPGDCRMTLNLFNNQVERLCQGEDIRQVHPLNNRSYVPAGSTALLDAIKVSIDDTRTRIEQACKQPIGFNASAASVKVVMAILTDGEENASLHATREDVFKEITACREKLGWEFLFLAANQDAIQSGAQLGVGVQDSVNFVANHAGMAQSFDCISERVSMSRGAPRPRKTKKGH